MASGADTHTDTHTHTYRRVNQNNFKKPGARSLRPQAPCLIRLRNRIGESSLNHLMLTAIESPDELTDSELDCIVNVWHEKPRRIVV